MIATEAAATRVPVAAVPTRSRPRAVVALLRPRQWIKNGLVVAAAGAAGAFGHDHVALRVAVAFIAFCLLASAIYAINDARDAAEDRLHPRKRRRPVAAGQLTAAFATRLGVGLTLAGLALLGALGPLPALVGAGYVALTVSYTLLWRFVFLLDIFAVAGGFVLRALAGGVAANVPLSRWFVLVVSAAAVFIAASKRLAELRRATAGGAAHRQVLHRYSPRMLEWILIGSALVATIAYCEWAFALPTVAGFPWRPLTVIPFAASLGRYLVLVRAGGGEAPEELVLGDPGLLISGLAWVVVFAFSVHAGS